MRTAKHFGLTSIDPQFDFSSVMNHVRRTRQTVYEQADAPPNLEKLGVEVIWGSSRFRDPHTIEIAESSSSQTVTSRYS